MLRFFRREGHEKEKTEQAVKRSRQTWFGRVSGLFQRGSLDDEIWDELEEILISADVGVATSAKLLDALRQRIRDERISDPQEALRLLKDEMVSLVSVEDAENALAVDEPPLVILVVGVNGVGKTTSIAKLANSYKESGSKVILGAADTFRAAAIEQLQMWGERLDVDVIAHQSGADPGAVAFDTLQAARSRGADVVIIDTAGRLHTKLNLMEELKKIQRVLANQGAESQRVILALDATTGQNGLMQARSFVDAVDCDGVFLAKLDGTAKGGVVFSIADELDLPVLYIGTGEQPDDIVQFNPEEFVNALLSPEDED
ncbi:MAG: signal recognition particle-docking protein FtsY [Chloroflexi bacterium]|nr:signal recognition particle-docking protein FtsY [Chloroflexota bacterium]